MSIACGYWRVRRFAIYLAAAAGCEYCLAGPDEHLFAMLSGHDCAATDTFIRQQIERECILPNAHMRQILSTSNDRSHHLLAGHIAESVDNAVVAVAPFATERDRAGLLVKLGS